MAIEDRAHAAQRKARDIGDLSFGGFHEREPRDCRSAQVMKCNPGNASGLAGFAPRSPKRSTIILTNSESKPWTSDGFRASATRRS